MHQLPPELKEIINQLGKRTNNKETIERIILVVCYCKSMKILELSAIPGISNKYLLREFITPMREKAKLTYTISDMPNHPEQAYKTVPKM